MLFPLSDPDTGAPNVFAYLDTRPSTYITRSLKLIWKIKKSANSDFGKTGSFLVRQDSFEVSKT